MPKALASDHTRLSNKGPIVRSDAKHEYLWSPKLKMSESLKLKVFTFYNIVRRQITTFFATRHHSIYWLIGPEERPKMAMLLNKES